MRRSEEAVAILGALVLEDGSRWGERATDVQRADVAAVLDPETGAAFHWWSRSRGWSKTLDGSGVAIALMLAQLPPASRLYCLAADADQARLVVDSIAGFAARTPELAGALEVGSHRISSPRLGSALEIVPADASSSWGLRPDFVHVDEFCYWAATATPKTLFDSVTTAAVKRSARVLITSTNGDPGSWQRRVWDLALRDAAWRVSEVHGPAPWLAAERVEAERRRLPDSTFRRLFLNEWASGEDVLATADAVDACATLDGPEAPRPGVRYVMTLDLGLVRDRTCVMVGYYDRTSDRVVLARKGLWKGRRIRPVRVTDVEAWILEAHKEYGKAGLLADKWQAADLLQRLRAKGVAARTFEFTQQGVGKLAYALFRALRDRRVALPADDVELLEELKRVRLVERAPGVYRMEGAEHDDQAVALALLCHRLLERSSAGPVEVASAAGQSLDAPLAAVMSDGSLGMRLRPGRRLPDGRWIPPLPDHLQPKGGRR